MPTKNLDFNLYVDTGATNPWGPANSKLVSDPSGPHAFPSGYTLLGDLPRISVGQLAKFSGSGNAIVLDDTPLTGDVIEAEVNLGTVSSESEGPLLASPAGVGWAVLCNNGNGTRLFNLTTGGVLGTQVGTAGPAITGSPAIARLRYIQSTDVIELYDGAGALIKSWTGVASANTDWRAGGLVRGAGAIASIKSIYTTAQSVNSINAGGDIESGQSAIPFASTGFNSNTITAITTNRAGVTCSGVANTGGGAGTFAVADMVDGVAYPALPSSVTYTFSDGTNTATITRNLNLESGWSQVAFSGAAPINNRVFCWHLQQAGLSIADGTIVIWETLDGFSFTDDGDSNSDVARIVLAKVRPVDTGIMSFWTVNINAAGEVVSAEITSVGTIRIGGTTPITVANFDGDISSGTLDGKALTSATNTEIVLAAMTNGVATYRTGTRTLTLTDGTDSDSIDVDVLPPTGWGAYTITADFVQAINGVAATYLPVGWAVGHFIFYQLSPSSGKTTTVGDAGVVTGNVGTQGLFLVHGTTGMATAFNVTTAAGAGGVGSGSTKKISSLGFIANRF